MNPPPIGPVARLAMELAARPSVTPNDAGCQEILAARLEKIGFHGEPLIFGDVTNHWIRFGAEAPLFVFAGHTDVVPPGNESHWRYPPFQPTVHDDCLFARGAADMKGSLAAMVVATERFVRTRRPTGSIAFLLTSDEEGPALDGTVKVVETLARRGEHIHYCLVGEPSSARTVGDVIRIGRRGSLGATLLVRGVQGHVAYPEQVVNPIHRFAPALSELAGSTWDRGNKDFPPTSFQFSNISAGTGATNVVPGTLHALFNFRFSTEVTVRDLQLRTKEILDRHGLDYELRWCVSGNPFLTARGELSTAVTEAITQHTGVVPELSTGGGTSDGRFIAPTGAQVIELGPVNETIHKVDECVNIHELENLATIYEGVLSRLL